MKITIKKKLWCKLKRPYYTGEKAGREGEIVGESKDTKSWWVKWNGIKSRYSYPKECITRLK